MGMLEARCQVAKRMGAEMYHAGVEISEVRSQLAKGQGAYLSTDERDAYDCLMPATFWAAFARGWNLASTGATRV